MDWCLHFSKSFKIWIYTRTNIIILINRKYYAFGNELLGGQMSWRGKFWTPLKGKNLPQGTNFAEVVANDGDEKKISCLYKEWGFFKKWSRTQYWKLSFHKLSHKTWFRRSPHIFKIYILMWINSIYPWRNHPEGERPFKLLKLLEFFFLVWNEAFSFYLCLFGLLINVLEMLQALRAGYHTCV